MEASDFVTSPFGSATRAPGQKWAFTYYSPKPIPTSLELDLSMMVELSTADDALGRLSGVSALINDPGILIGPYIRREAVASSRIEGTQASLSDVLQAEISSDAQNDDTAEVQRYLDATRLAYDLSADLPITQRLILQVHEVLLRGVRGEEKNPGEFRRTPVWVGAADATPESAAFVPPLPDEIPGLLSDWEDYVNSTDVTMPVLVRAALMHYQFETIHPFLDGSGRIGRLLINIFLKEQGRLRFPLLYLSNFFESHRSEYYASLQGVRERGDIDTWIRFFLRAVTAQSNDAVTRSHQLIDIREQYRNTAARQRSKIGGLVEMIVRNPYVTVKSVEAELGLTNQGSRNLIRKAEEIGWLTSLGAFGRGGREHWVAQEVFRVMEAPMIYRAP